MRITSIHFNYIAYILAYFGMTITRVYLIVYLPAYFLAILDVNRVELAFVQIFSYSFLFSIPFLSLVFDFYVEKKKGILALSSVGLFVSFIELYYG